MQILALLKTNFTNKENTLMQILARLRINFKNKGNPLVTSNVRLKASYSQEESYKKAFIYRALSDRSIRSAHSKLWKTSPASFIRKLSKGKRRFLNSLVWSNRNWKTTKASDGYFAKKVGVVRETICRYRSFFQEHGLITQKKGHMEVCTIILSDTFKDPKLRKLLAIFLPAMFSFNLSLLCSQKRERSTLSKQTHIVKKNNVTPYYTPSFSYSININKNLFLLAKGDVSNYKKGKIRRELVKVMLAKEQREYISQRKDHPKAREALLSPRTYDLIITQKIKNIAGVLDLTEQEMLKCVVFQQSALDYAIGIVIKGKDVKSPKGLFFGKATAYAKANNQRIEWGWYQDVCYILGIKPFKVKVPEEDDMRKAPIDNDSQHRFEEFNPPSAKKVEAINYLWKGPVEKKEEAPVVSNNFLEMFPIPDIVKENDRLKQKGITR